MRETVSGYVCSECGRCFCSEHLEMFLVATPAAAIDLGLDTVLCKSSPPLISLYFASEMGKRCTETCTNTNGNTV